MEKPFFTLLKNVHIIAPEDLGVKDILMAGEKSPLSVKI